MEFSGIAWDTPGRAKIIPTRWFRLNSNMLICRHNSFRQTAKNRLGDPSETRAPEFKEEFPRSAICSVSATIAINWSIFLGRPLGKRQPHPSQKTVTRSPSVRLIDVRYTGPGLLVATPNGWPMEVRRTLPHPALRGVVRSFGERHGALGATELSWPLTARPHQIIDIFL